MIELFLMIRLASTTLDLVDELEPESYFRERSAGCGGYRCICGLSTWNITCLTNVMATTPSVHTYAPPHVLVWLSCKRAAVLELSSAHVVVLTELSFSTLAVSFRC